MMKQQAINITIEQALQNLGHAVNSFSGTISELNAMIVSYDMVVAAVRGNKKTDSPAEASNPNIKKSKSPSKNTTLKTAKK